MFSLDQIAGKESFPPLYKKKDVGPQKRARWVEQAKRGDLSWLPGTCVKLGMAAYICNPALGGQKQVDPQGLAYQLNELK